MKWKRLFMLLMFVILYGQGNPFAEDLQGRVVIFHAGSLSKPLLDVERAFVKLHPGVKIYREASGSLAAIRKITELKKAADIIAVSDWELIPKLLVPQYCSQYHIFARNRLVIAYTEKSKYASEINRNNWYSILTRKDVKIGRADPERDPCGYRTLMMWQLAEKYYRVPGLYRKLMDACPKENVRPKETDLIALQESGELDYHFNYKSVAVAHNFKYLELPPEIDLSDGKFEKFYAQSSVTVSGKSPETPLVIRGSAILYGIAVLKDAKNRKIAQEFVNFILSEEGQAIIAETGLTPVK